VSHFSFQWLVLEWVLMDNSSVATPFTSYICSQFLAKELCYRKSFICLELSHYMKRIKTEAFEKWVVKPLERFINRSSTSGIILFSSALIALVWSNSAFQESYHHLWEYEFIVGFQDFNIHKSLHHWINDGLMAIFFFVVGLELKREIISGQLSNPANAILPIAAAAGGMVVPALLYYFINPTGEASNGWGIPMATDIAFALGVLYLLGDKVPTSIKVFLTALAIADDIGAVLVIAFFYTSDINMVSLGTGVGFMVVLVTANLLGIRNTLFYGIVGIGGLWTAFLMSGVHATIAAVLAAFTIPAYTAVDESYFSMKMNQLIDRFNKEKPNKKSTVTDEQLHLIERIRRLTYQAATPLQSLEYHMHPLVAFLVMPIFALANAGISFGDNIADEILSPVAIGVFTGLFVGKVVGVVGMVFLLCKLKIASLPDEFNYRDVFGIGFLSAIGFTMSLFVSGLAFTTPDYVQQAKLGILVASILASFIGFFLINRKRKPLKAEV
jgi:NhaA family Na+:H+ antiporter